MRVRLVAAVERMMHARLSLLLLGDRLRSGLLNVARATVDLLLGLAGCQIGCLFAVEDDEAELTSLVVHAIEWQFKVADVAELREVVADLLLRQVAVDAADEHFLRDRSALSHFDVDRFAFDILGSVSEDLWGARERES